MVIEGLPYFLFPDKTKKFYDQIRAADSKLLRVIGFSIIAFGLVIVYLVRGDICK